jgi:hypothetical protein
MKYLKVENDALRKELTELLLLTIETTSFLRMVQIDLKVRGIKEDLEYVTLLLKSNDEKILKLKNLIDE